MICILDLFLRDYISLVYFDEVYTLCPDVHFRHKFELFWRLTLAVPWIFLTTTLPPPMTQGFEESLVMTRPRLKYIRAAINKPLIFYLVMQMDDGQLLIELTRLLNESIHDLKSNEKILIFRPSVDKVKRIRSEIQCCVYYSDLPGKSDSLSAWERGEEKVMVAMSALGAGINISEVVHVFHVGKPYVYV